ncbi:N-acetyltransferase ECO1, putative [Entamoeba invadens IP1]|uniref:N-acetyltransferase ECO1, putative n=1 Tax=Entamoeba invadens IP1 TaxID=370355 RepID=UPI0002C3FB93|nr:N-acetyltransferase ECO1, putative [Entamoeba invadens IP1]ELP93143.1 N-acetyltransferase ECO1, putative [Entamoeba invadens IP1]|eukprot:XP_004259914.1 N-acetyltransferase ECO1, putative [Entamoeba invadens IP1]
MDAYKRRKEEKKEEKENAEKKPRKIEASFSRVLPVSSDKLSRVSPRVSARTTPLHSPTPKTSPVPSPKRQSVLNFAQKRPGETTCVICHLKYQPSVDDDKKTHDDYHKKYVQPQKFKVKDAVQVQDSPKVVKVVCSRENENELAEILARVKDDVDMSMEYLLSSRYTFFIGVEDGKVVSLLVVCTLSPLTSAYLVTSNLYGEISLKEENKTVCKMGIELLWVHPFFKRRGFGKSLVELSLVFLKYGTYAFKKEEVAITQPTHEGFLFFKHVFPQIQIYTQH